MSDFDFIHTKCIILLFYLANWLQHINEIKKKKSIAQERTYIMLVTLDKYIKYIYISTELHAIFNGTWRILRWRVSKFFFLRGIFVFVFWVFLRGDGGCQMKGYFLIEMEFLLHVHCLYTIRCSWHNIIIHKQSLKNFRKQTM